MRLHSPLLPVPLPSSFAPPWAVLGSWERGSSSLLTGAGRTWGERAARSNWGKHGTYNRNTSTHPDIGLQTTHAHNTCTQHMHTTHAHNTCTQHMDTAHACAHHTCTHQHIHICTVHSHKHTHTRAYTNTHTHAHMYAHTYVDTSEHTSTCCVSSAVQHMYASLPLPPKIVALRLQLHSLH